MASTVSLAGIVEDHTSVKRIARPPTPTSHNTHALGMTEHLRERGESQTKSKARERKKSWSLSIAIVPRFAIASKSGPSRKDTL